MSNNETEDAWFGGLATGMIPLILLVVGFGLGSCTARNWIDDDCRRAGATVVMGKAYTCAPVENDAGQ